MGGRWSRRQQQGTLEEVKAIDSESVIHREEPCDEPIGTKIREKDHALILDLLSFFCYAVKPHPKFSDGCVHIVFGAEGHSGDEHAPDLEVTIVFRPSRNGDPRPTVTVYEGLPDASLGETETCRIEVPYKHFLKIYSGKATGRDILQLMREHSLRITGWASVVSFGYSFEYRKELWDRFYEARERGEGVLQEGSGEGDRRMLCTSEAFRHDGEESGGAAAGSSGILDKDTAAAAAGAAAVSLSVRGGLPLLAMPLAAERKPAAEQKVVLYRDGQWQRHRRLPVSLATPWRLGSGAMLWMWPAFNPSDALWHLRRRCMPLSAPLDAWTSAALAAMRRRLRSSNLSTAVAAGKETPIVLDSFEGTVLLPTSRSSGNPYADPAASSFKSVFELKVARAVLAWNGGGGEDIGDWWAMGAALGAERLLDAAAREQR